MTARIEHAQTVRLLRDNKHQVRVVVGQRLLNGVAQARPFFLEQSLELRIAHTIAHVHDTLRLLATVRDVSIDTLLQCAKGSPIFTKTD